MILLALARHLIFTRSDGRDGTISYYYYDAVTWTVVALALAGLAWFFIRAYLHARAMRRPSRQVNRSLLKRLVRIKSEFSSINLRPGFSTAIHAIGLGLLAGTNEYCIQVFINDVNAELWNGAGAATLPNTFRGVPVILIEMPIAGFLSGAVPAMIETPYPPAIREYQEVIIGGISGAHTNLTGQSGTIGYFCTRKSRLARRKEIHLLSNSHVFVDLRKKTIDDSDLILQPSPGEPGSNRSIGALVDFSPMKFNGELEDPNHIDAAIARLWRPQPHHPLIPMIGSVKGYVPRQEVALGESARKFGRTTGYTEGRVFSIFLDIWIRYDQTGQSAFFQNQLLIEPSVNFSKFASKGDSGSLLVDAEQHALGLIFAGMSEAPDLNPTAPRLAADPAREKLQRIEGYGVANPISEVLDRMKIDLLV